MYNPLNKLIEIYDWGVTTIKSKIYNFFNDKLEKNLVEENIYLFLEHFVFFNLGVLFFSYENWFYDITMMNEYNLTSKILTYYTLYIVRYLVQIKNLQDEKDYTSKMIHHISTVLLLSLSLFHYHRIGVIIAVSHDLGDLFLLPAKVCHKSYEVRKNKILNTLSYLLFTLFFFSFFFTRIILNSNIIYYMSSELIPYNYIYPEGYILFALLFVNLSLQIFWQVMIVKFAYKLIKGEKPKDEKGNEYFKEE